MAIALNERNIPHEKCLVDLQNKPENFTSTYARVSPAVRAESSRAVTEALIASLPELRAEAEERWGKHT